MAQLAAHYSPRRWRSQACHAFIAGQYAGDFLPLTGVLCVVLLAILADQSTINSEALINSLTMGLVATFIALLLLLLWLEWGPQRRQLWLWLPILLPALPLVAGQYTLALWLNLDGSWTAVVWGHLLWVMPWMLFILSCNPPGSALIHG